MSKKRRRHDRTYATATQAPVTATAAETTEETAAAPELQADSFAAEAPAETIEPAKAVHETEHHPRHARGHESHLATSGDLFPMPAGLRLRAAREARGLTREEVARTAHIPSAVLADIEADRMEQMAPIYARGYLRSFARVVGVPEVDVVGTNTAEHEVPALVPSHSRSRSRHLVQRYGNLLAYAMLTMVVLVPIVMFGVRPGSAPTPVPAPDLAELDVIPSQPAASQPAVSPPGAVAAQAREPDPASLTMGPPQAEPMATAEPAPSPVRPVMASMAPLPESPVETAVEPPAPLTARKVVLHLAQSSWVELTGAEGQRIEYALLPAGTVREYQIAGNANLRIGNSRGATLSVDGTAVDLAAHSRSNVARVALGAEPAGR